MEIGNHGSFFCAVLPPSPLKKQKNQNFDKIEKIAGDIIILHMCTKKHNHMRYRVRDRIFCPFGPFFALLPPPPPPSPPINPEYQNFEKMKKASGDVITLHMSTKNHDHMMYAS